MNSIKNIWSQFLKFIKFVKNLISQISNDRYEAANALIIVVLSIVALYIPIISANFSSNLVDIVFYGIVDGIFAWLLSNLAIWFLLSRAFNTFTEVSNLMIFTGYSHGLVGLFGVLYFINSQISFDLMYFQIASILIFCWIYLVLSKSLTISLHLESRVSSISAVTFLVLLVWFSDPIRIFI